MGYNAIKRFSEMEWSQLEFEQIKDFMVNELMVEIRKDVMRHVELESHWDIQHGGFEAKASVDLDFGVPIKDFSIRIPNPTDDFMTEAHKAIVRESKKMAFEKLRRNLGYDFDEPIPNLNKIVADAQAEAYLNSFNPGRINNNSLENFLNTVPITEVDGSYFINGEVGEAIDVTDAVKALKKKKDGNSQV